MRFIFFFVLTMIFASFVVGVMGPIIERWRFNVYYTELVDNRVKELVEEGCLKND